MAARGCWNAAWWHFVDGDVDGGHTEDRQSMWCPSFPSTQYVTFECRWLVNDDGTAMWREEINFTLPCRAYFSSLRPVYSCTCPRMHHNFFCFCIFMLVQFHHNVDGFPPLECLIQAHQATGKTSFLLFADTLSFRKKKGEYEYRICEVHKVGIIYAFDFLHIWRHGKGGLTFYYRSAELLSKSDSITYSCTYSPCCDQQHLHPESCSIS